MDLKCPYCGAYVVTNYDDITEQVTIYCGHDIPCGAEWDDVGTLIKAGRS
jgi:hypothetical protein